MIGQRNPTEAHYLNGVDVYRGLLGGAVLSVTNWVSTTGAHHLNGVDVYRGLPGGAVISLFDRAEQRKGSTLP